MFSIRNGRGIFMGLALGASPLLLGISGCEINKQPSSSVSKVSTAPLIIDRATEIRDAEPNTAWYSNGSAVAGGTAFVFKPSDKTPPALRRFTDAPVAALNDASLPVGIFLNPPWRKTVYSGEVVPPSYNAMPPLPEGEQKWEPGAMPPKSHRQRASSEAPMPPQSVEPAPTAQPSEPPPPATEESMPAPVVQPTTAPPATQDYPQ